MPANLVADMNTHPGGLEDQRALQLALELSMLGISQNGEDHHQDTSSAAPTPQQQAPGLSNPSPTFDQMDEAQRIKRGANMTECVPVPSSEHVAEIVGRQGCKIKALRAKTNTYIKTPVRGEEPVFVVTGRKEDVQAAKREIQSAADHFSQIRASRRSQSQGGAGSVGGVGSIVPGPPSPTTPGQVTIQVRVPYRVVGLVVGPKGATIKRIQQQTHTYIVTPSRDKEPVFEVTGSPENAEQARKEIESHIALRTGGIHDSPNQNANMASTMPTDEALNQLNDFHSNGIDSGFQDLGNDLLSSIYNKGGASNGGNHQIHQGAQNSAFTAYNSAAFNSNNTSSSTTSSTSHQQHPPLSHHQHHHSNQDNSSIFTFPSTTPALSNGYHHHPAHHHHQGVAPHLTKINHDFNTTTTNGFGFYDNDDSLISPVFGSEAPVPMGGSVWSDLGDQPCLPMFTSAINLPRRNSSGFGSATTPRLSPVLTDSSSGSHTSLRRIGSDPMTSNLNGMLPSISNGSGSPTLSSNSSSSSSYATTSMASLSESSSSSPTESGLGLSSIIRPPPGRRHCLVCGDGEVVAAFVPCGHNLFCMDCANRVMEKGETERRCPVCQHPPSQAIRIFS